LRLGRAAANPALRGAGPEAGATDLRPDHSYSVRAPRGSSTLRGALLLFTRNWDRYQSSGLRSHKREAGRDPLLVAAFLINEINKFTCANAVTEMFWLPILFSMRSRTVTCG